MEPILVEIQRARQLYLLTIRWLIAQITAQPGYNQVVVDAWTREYWRLAAAGEREVAA